jgi:hypothetical protein
MALACAALPAPAFAQKPEAADAFDLRAVTGRAALLSGSPRSRVQAPGAGREPGRPEKVRLRLTYQPDEAGPRFEIGTIGSRKGAMKSRMLHVAMDWVF